jgi:transcriptional regulator with XRE-family HTH domain
MTEITITKSSQNSDEEIIRRIGEFVRYHRLENNWTQQDLAKRSGINRTTLSDLELGRGCQLLTIIQVLRILNKLDTLESFEVRQQISPIKLAELEKEKRKKASGNSFDNSITKTDW